MELAVKDTRNLAKLNLGVVASAIFLVALGSLGSRGAEMAAQTFAADLRPGYAGDATCASCHVKESSSYAHTAHRKASQPVDARSILGNFNEGENLLKIVDQDPHRATDSGLPMLSFSMERKGDEFFETALTGWGSDLHRRSESIAVVTGSGVRGQTYLYWQGDRLFELPVSYWREGRRWINSPGYIDGTVDFARPVTPGCLECHASYIKATSAEATTNSYVKDSLVTGIGCETCHGPGAEHAAKYAVKHQGEAQSGSEQSKFTSGTAILNPAKFSRDRQIDSCAVCHNGTARTALQPAYTFVPGRPLSEFFAPLQGQQTAEHPDVHGNQVGLLERSKCFQNSDNLSCSTCHDVHAPERVSASYSDKCLSCHSWQSCGISKTRGIAIKKNCIDCHMPVESTNLIVSETAGSTVRARMRNHWIKVYPAPHSPRGAGL